VWGVNKLVLGVFFLSFAPVIRQAIFGMCADGAFMVPLDAVLGDSSFRYAPRQDL
jgi:hypothetical protein